MNNQSSLFSNGISDEEKSFMTSTADGSTFANTLFKNFSAIIILNHRSITAALQGRTYKSQKTFPTKKIDAFKFLFLNYSN